MASSDTHFIMVILPIDVPSSVIVFSTVTRMFYLEQKIKVFDIKVAPASTRVITKITVFIAKSELLQNFPIRLVL